MRPLYRELQRPRGISLRALTVPVPTGSDFSRDATSLYCRSNSRPPGYLIVKKAFCIFALSCCSVFAGADDTLKDPETWYRDAYAPLWAQDPASNVDKMQVFFADTIKTHSSDGQITRTDKSTWLREPMREWLADGWLTSELQGLQVDRINETTTSFKASWLDRYEESYEELACGWYLADLVDGAWQFTAYADLDCGAHGF